MRALGVASVGLMLAVSGCASAAPTKSTEACTDPKATAQRYLEAANEDRAAIDRHSRNGNPASPADVTPLRDAQAAWRHDMRLAGQVIVGNPTCFDAQARAQAQEILEQLPAE
jgi:hypothetical protein